MPRRGLRHRSKTRKKPNSESAEARERLERHRRTIFLHGDTKYEILKECAQRSGWLIVDEEEYSQVVKSQAQTIKWSDWPTHTKKINRNHKCNRMPGIRLICDKEKLSDLVESIRGEFEDDMLRFVPRSWSLPRDMQSFGESLRSKSTDDSQNPSTSSDCSDLRDRDNIALKNGKKTLPKRRKDKWFIVKPSKGLQGRGIHICCSLNQIEKIIRATPAVHVAQKYIENPLLIEGLKFDMRVYVVVTSADPIRAFVFPDGLVRLCTQEYQRPDRTNASESTMHLTNYSLNKKSDAYLQPTEHSGGHNPQHISGSKRSILWLRKWLRSKGKDDAEMWRRVCDVCTKTLLLAQPGVQNIYTKVAPNDSMSEQAFQLLGFDILLDSALNPHLLEVNHSPSLFTDSPLDRKIKKDLVMDMFRIINLDTKCWLLLKRWHMRQSRERLYSSRRSRSGIDLMTSFTSMSDTTGTTPDPKRFKREEIRKKLADGELERCQRFERLLPFTPEASFLQSAHPMKVHKLKESYSDLSVIAQMQWERRHHGDKTKACRLSATSRFIKAILHKSMKSEPRVVSSDMGDVTATKSSNGILRRVNSEPMEGDSGQRQLRPESISSNPESRQPQSEPRELQAEPRQLNPECTPESTQPQPEPRELQADPRRLEPEPKRSHAESHQSHAEAGPLSKLPDGQYLPSKTSASIQPNVRALRPVNATVFKYPNRVPFSVKMPQAVQRNKVRSAGTNSRNLMGSFSKNQARPIINLSSAELQPLDYGQLFENVNRGEASRSQSLKQPQQQQSHRSKNPQRQSRSRVYQTVPLSMVTQQSRKAARYQMFRRFPISPIIPGTTSSFNPRHAVKTRSKARSKDFGSSSSRNLGRTGRIFESQSVWRHLKQRL